MNDLTNKPRNARKKNPLARELLRAVKQRQKTRLPSLTQTCETAQAMPAKRPHVFGPYQAGLRALPRAQFEHVLSAVGDRC